MRRVDNPNPAHCVAQVSDHDSRWPRSYQCHNKRTVGEFCKRHAPKEGSEIWWRVDRQWLEPRVIRREFAGSTDTQLCTKDGTREAKSSQYHLWFPSFEEAKEALVRLYQAKIRSLEDGLEHARIDRTIAEKLEPPHA